VKPRPDAAPSRMMTAAEVAQYLQLHSSTVYRLIHQGQIPVFKMGGDYRFDKDAIKKWITNRKV